MIPLLKGLLLQEKDFGKVDLFVPHESNPQAKKAWTTLKVYEAHTVEDAYLGKSFFWALNPQPGDTVNIEFATATIISSYLFKSGNPEHPTDQFYDAVVEVATAPGLGNETYSWTQVGKFHRGIAEGALPNKAACLAIRIRALTESAFWVTLREVSLLLQNHLVICAVLWHIKQRTIRIQNYIWQSFSSEESGATQIRLPLPLWSRFLMWNRKAVPQVNEKRSFISIPWGQ